MGVGKVVNLLLCLLFIPVVKSEDSALTIAKQSTMITGARCTSRKIPPSILNSSNGTVPTGTNNTVGGDGMGNGDESDAIPQILDPFCPEGYFCDLSRAENKTTDVEVFGFCTACSGSSDLCVPSPTMSESIGDQEFLTFTLKNAVAEECQEQCGVGKNTCSSTMGCPQGLFCNFEDSEVGGYCEMCPAHLFFCANWEDRNLTSKGLQSCESSCAVDCRPKGKVTIESPGSVETTFTEFDDVNGMILSPQLSVTGPVVDCQLGKEPCVGVEDSICLIERGQVPFGLKATNCYAGGGIAAVIYNLEKRCENIDGNLFGYKINIPVVSLTHLEGKNLLNRAKNMPPEMPLLATVEVGGQDVLQDGCRSSCTIDIGCKDTDMSCDMDNGAFGDCVATKYKAPCNRIDPSDLTPLLQCTEEERFCDFSKGKRGECSECPKFENQCFFSDLNQEGAMECNQVCAGGSLERLQSPPCKFCVRGDFSLEDVGDGFLSTNDKNITKPCEFCGSTSNTSTCSSEYKWDMEHPYRTIKIMGDPVPCWQVAEFYRGVNIEADSDYCQTARTMNYICGCRDSSGYGGANTEARKVVLAWIPRVGAILSILGSTLMILEVLQDEEKKKKVIGELIIFLSAFDIIGSIGYAFTSYPTPKEDYIYGANGNGVSCSFQGFFIQIGTISLYLNVSIAFYYLLIIQCSWREHRLKKSRVYYMLFAVPILIGSAFAFAGIPFYDNNILWCNNSRSYWSEIPVAVAIAIATVIMLNLCWFVYKSERASRRFRHDSENRNSLSLAFFKQSLVYLGAFYLTWPPYLAMQIMISTGAIYSQYYVILFSGLAVTLQGFWNYLFHTAHTRVIKNRVNRAVATVRSIAFTSRITRSRASAMAKASAFNRASTDDRASTNDRQNNGERSSNENGLDNDELS